MSKYVKQLLTDELKGRLDGVEEAVLVNVVGLTANTSVSLRKQLKEKNIRLMVIKNSLARRATEGTPLAAAFEGTKGTNAIMWGAEDIVSLAKEAMALHKDEEDLAAFETKGGIMDGEALTPERIKEISKWPSRGEVLSTIAGQLLGPGANLAAQLKGPGGQLASQIKSYEGKAEEKVEAKAEAKAEAAPEAAPEAKAEEKPEAKADDKAEE